MKWWRFGTIMNGIILCGLYALFLILGNLGVDKFIALLPDMGNSEEVIRSFLTLIKIDLAAQWEYLVITLTIFLFLLFLLAIHPFVMTIFSHQNSIRPNMFFYTLISILSIPLGTGIIMLFSLPRLKRDTLELRREWLEEEDSLNEQLEEAKYLGSKYEIECDSQNNYYNDEINQSEKGDKFNDYFKQEKESIYLEEENDDYDETYKYQETYDYDENDYDENDYDENDDSGDYEDLGLDLVDEKEQTPSYQPGYTRRSELTEKFDNYTKQSHDKIFTRINSTDKKIREVEKDTSMLKEQLIKIENELDRMENNYSERAKEISLRRKLREIEYDLEDNKNYLERLKKRQ